MKNLSLFIVLFLFVSAQSQNIEYLYASDSTKAIELSNKIASQFRVKSSYCSSSFMDRNEKEIFEYCNDSGKIVLKIMYDLKWEGANKDLEIQGKKTYFLSGLYGKFIDILNVWKLIDPNANQDEILKKGESKYLKYEVGGEKKRIQISKEINEDNSWTIMQTTSFY